MLDEEMQMKLLIQERPWEKEPDLEEWVDEATGYKCTVMRHASLEHLNGYVAIPKGHKVWGKGEDVMDVDVHGGLTYSSVDKETDEWVLGFDCSHVDDFSPKLVLTLMKYTDSRLEHHTQGTYRTFEWVKEEVVKLAKQLGEME